MILDVSLPGLNGLDLQKRIATDRVDMPIIFITGHGDVPMTVQAMKAGAVEFRTWVYRVANNVGASHVIRRRRAAERLIALETLDVEAAVDSGAQAESSVSAAKLLQFIS